MRRGVVHPLPRPDAAVLPELLAWATAALLAGCALWALRGRLQRSLTGVDGAPR